MYPLIAQVRFTCLLLCTVRCTFECTLEALQGVEIRTVQLYHDDGLRMSTLRCKAPHLVVLQVPALDLLVQGAGEHVRVAIRHRQPRHLQPAQASVRDVLRMSCWNHRRRSTSSGSSGKPPLRARQASCVGSAGGEPCCRQKNAAQCRQTGGPQAEKAHLLDVTRQRQLQLPAGRVPHLQRDNQGDLGMMGTTITIDKTQNRRDMRSRWSGRDAQHCRTGDAAG